MDKELRAQIAALLPPIRPHLLAGVLAFTQAASQVPGVARIALIGSLAADKAEPKDADVLVTVADDADLMLLAAHGRKLLGPVLGTLDRDVWKRGITEPLEIQQMVEQLQDFVEVLELRRPRIP